MSRTTQLPAAPKITAAAVSTPLGEITLPQRTHQYWIDLLIRCGLRPREGLGGPIAFLPPEAKVDAATLLRLRTAGTALVGAFELTSRLLPATSWRQRVAGITGDGILFEGCETIRMPATIHTIGQDLSSVDASAGVPVIGLPLPTAAEALAARPAMQEFEVAPSVQVAEIVAGTDHGGLRRLVNNALRLAHELRGLPFVRLGVAPVTYSGTLGIRIDADDFDSDSTATVAAALARSELPATWFIDVERHAIKHGGPAVIDLQAAGHEVQSHFFHHYTYASADRNLRNLQRSRDILATWGIETEAAVAPFGSFNDGLREALARARVRWSSEFSAIYDDLPTSIAGCAQIPVHPICPSLLLQAGLDRDAVIDYYASRLRNNLIRHEPTIFYGHPIGDLDAVPELFHRLRSVAEEHQQWANGPVWTPTMSEFKALFDARHHQSFECALIDGELRGTCDGIVPLIVEHRDAPAQQLSGSFASPFEAAAITMPEGGFGTARPWLPMNPRQLRRRQRIIRFRRWLREIRNR